MQAINVVPAITGPVSHFGFSEQDPAVAQPPVRLVTFTEIYCQANGSNLNAGSDQNAAAKYTSTNGNWSTVTLQFTPTDGTNPVSSGVKVGDMASIYIDGATVGVFISRITAVVDAANGPITVLAGSGNGGAGTAPTTSATARTIKVGGALLGPNAASGFPLTLSNIMSLRDVVGHTTRVNLKNDQTYSLTASFSVDNTSGPGVIQGYSVIPGDGELTPWNNTSKATLDGGVSTGQILSNFGIAANVFRDLIFSTSFASGTSHLVQGVSTVEFTRCVFKGARGSGCVPQGAAIINECEASSCGLGNAVNSSGFGFSAVNVNVFRTIVHDCPGSNVSGFFMNAGGVVLHEVICARIGLYGVSVLGNSAFCRISNSDFYKIDADAIHVPSTVTSGGTLWVENCNFIMLRGAGIVNLATSVQGLSYNNAYGSVPTGDTLNNIIEVGKITYPQDTTPWVDPDNGNFGLISALAISSGRGNFTVTQVYSGTTTGYPDVGAADANAATQSLSWENGNFVLPIGYIGYNYTYTWQFAVPADFTIHSGSLPPGLALIAVSSNIASISGTPTTIGTYTFVVRATIGTSVGDAAFTITINNDPDEGVGVVGGG